MRKIRFLIIGASGFIGSYIYEYAYQRYQTQGTRNTTTELTYFDLLKHRIQDRVVFSDDKTIVVICAAISKLADCKTPQAYEFNVTKTKQLIDDLSNHNTCITFLSTNCVYDGEIGYYDENSPHTPINQYGKQKEEIEQYLNTLPNTLIYRLDKIVSDRMVSSNLLAEWYQKIKDKEPIICLDQTISFTYVKDIARAVVDWCGLQGTYNVSNPEYFTRKELLIQFMHSLGKGTEIIMRSHEEFNFPDYVMKKGYLDSTKFRKETGMQFTSMREVFKLFRR